MIKHSLLSICLSYLIGFAAFAQSPEKISYQTVIRDAEGNLVKDKAVGMRISIIQGFASGTAVYTETHTPVSNANGLVSLEIGTGSSSGNFSVIDWSNGPFFIRTETDPNGGTSYSISGTSQILSVPYALHAKTADTASYVGLSGQESFFDNWDKDSEDDFTGEFSELTGIPSTLDTDSTDDFSGSFNDLVDVPTNLDTDATDDFSGHLIAL